MHILQRTCRICAKIKSEDLKNLFSSHCSKILKQIEQIIGMKFSNGANLPQKICHQCLEDLKQANAFRSRCLKMQSYFETDKYQEDLLGQLNENEHYDKQTPALVDDDLNAIDVIEREEEEIEAEYVDWIEEENILESSPEEAQVDCLEDEDLREDCDNDTNDLSHDEVYILHTESENEYDENDEEKNSSSETTNVACEFRPNMKLWKKGNVPVKAHNFVCDQCGSCFDNSNHFITHQHRHQGYKPYDCKLCPSKFYTKSELKRHGRVHTGERPYACKYCDNKFSDNSTRIKHQRTHTKERPYTCITCNKKFAAHSNLKEHSFIHSGLRQFSCTLCNKDFQRHTHLISHYRSLTHQQKAEKQQEFK